HDEILQMLTSQQHDMDQSQGFCLEICPVHKKEKLKSKLEEQLEPIRELRKEDNFSEAALLLKKIRKEYDSFPEFQIERGFVYRGLGNNERALRAFKKAKELGETDHCVHCFIGNTLTEMGELEEAKKELEEVIFQSPDVHCKFLFEILGFNYSKTGSVEEVTRIVSELEPSEDKKNCSACLSAILFYWVKAYDKAYQKISPIEDETCEGFLFFREVLRGHLDQKKEAIRAIEHIKLDFKISPTYLNLLRDILSFYETIGECNGLKKLSNKISTEIDWGRRIKNLGMMLERIGYTAWHNSCNDKTYYLQLLQNAREHHDCSALRQGIIIYLRATEKDLEACDFALESINDFPEDFILFGTAVVTLFRASEHEKIPNMINKALQFEESLKDPTTLIKLSIIAKKIGDNLLYEKVAINLVKICETRFPDELSKAKEILVDAKEMITLENTNKKAI
ncbi:MAG: tetratricopeptide repeat protein, partial [Candidatus Hodarchaeota archaeon]